MLYTPDLRTEDGRGLKGGALPALIGKIQIWQIAAIELDEEGDVDDLKEVVSDPRI